MAAKKTTKKRPAKRAPRKTEPETATVADETAAPEKPKRKPPGRKKKASKKAPRKKKTADVVAAEPGAAEAAEAAPAAAPSTGLPPAPPEALPAQGPPEGDGAQGSAVPLVPLEKLFEQQGSPQAQIPTEVPEATLAQLQAGVQSQACEEKTHRVLVTIPASLYDRLQRIASLENRRFGDDEDLSIAQQAAMFVEAGVAMWEQDLANPHNADALLEEPDYAEALRMQFSGATTRGMQP